MKFFSSIEIPRLKQKFQITELNYGDFCALQKLLQNNNLNDIDIFFDNIIAQNCTPPAQFNFLEKFYILLFMRTISIGADFEFRLSENEVYKYQLDAIISKLQASGCLNFCSTVTHADFALHYTLPFKFFSEDIFDHALDSIDTVVFKNSVFSLPSMPPDAKDNILSKLPSHLLLAIEEKLIQQENLLNQITVTLPKVIHTEPLALSLKNGVCRELLKLFFKSNLNEIYEKQYLLLTKTSSTLQDLYMLTPGEVNIMFTLMTREAQETLKATKAPTGPSLAPPTL